jgi:hypothetical protein
MKNKGLVFDESGITYGGVPINDYIISDDPISLSTQEEIYKRNLYFEETIGKPITNNKYTIIKEPSDGIVSALCGSIIIDDHYVLAREYNMLKCKRKIRLALNKRTYNRTRNNL